MLTRQTSGTVGGGSRIAVIDLETTGFRPRSDRVVEIAVVTLSLPDLSICDEFDTLLNPERDIGAQHIHGISPDMVVGAPTFREVAATLAEHVHGAVLVCHNIGFDVPFLAHEFTRAGGVFHPGTPRCTLAATRQKLSVACRDHDIPLSDAHSALADARATALLARKMLSLDAHGSAQAEVCAQAQAVHTLRRNRDSASRLGRIIERARYPETDEATRLYLNGAYIDKLTTPTTDPVRGSQGSLTGSPLAAQKPLARGPLADTCGSPARVRMLIAALWSAFRRKPQTPHRKTDCDCRLDLSVYPHRLQACDV